MTSELYSDAAGRSFYARWRELMNTPGLARGARS